MNCAECGERRAELGRQICFRCRIRSIGFTFTGGGGYGRTAFKERTTAEYIRENVPADGSATPIERGCWT